jgi:hypothetical protein
VNIDGKLIYVPSRDTQGPGSIGTTSIGGGGSAFNISNECSCGIRLKIKKDVYLYHLVKTEYHSHQKFSAHLFDEFISSTNIHGNSIDWKSHCNVVR